MVRPHDVPPESPLAPRTGDRDVVSPHTAHHTPAGSPPSVLEPSASIPLRDDLDDDGLAPRRGEWPISAFDPEHRSESLYRSLIENLQGAVYHCEVLPPWRMDLMSEGVRVVTGRPASDFLSGRVTWTDIVHPDDEPRIERAVAEGVARHEPFSLVYRIIHADGHQRWVQENGQAIYDEAGKAIFLDGVILDVTDRLRTEEALAASERRYRVLFDQMSQGVVYQNADGAITWANPAAQRILGLSLEQMQGRASLDARWRSVHEDGSDFPGQDHPAMVALRTGQPVRGIVMGVSHGATLQHRWLEIDAVPEFEPGQSQPSRVFTTFTDITERWRSERIGAARARLMERAPALDLRGLLTATLDEAERLTDSRIGFYHFVSEDEHGLSLQAWSTRTEREYCTAEGHGMHYPIDQAGIWADAVRRRQPVIHADYAAIPNRRGLPPGHADLRRELVVPVLRSGRVVAIIGVGNKDSDYTDQDLDAVTRLADLAWDMAERKRAELALHDSESRYRMISENTSDVIWVLDLTTRRLRYMSPSVSRLTGYTVDEVLACSLGQMLTPASFALSMDILTSRLAAFVSGDMSVRTQSSELQQIRKDGTVVDVEVVSTIIASPDGQPVELIGVSRDISARKRLEEQFLQAQKLEAIGLLAGGVAHDFNNILAAMLMQTEMLLETPGLPADVITGLGALEKQEQRASNLTRQLLLFSRRQVMQVRRVELNDVVGGFLAMLMRLIGETIETRFLPGSAAMLLDADTGMLEQLLMNLCVNARDAMPRGGQLTLTTRVESITASDVRARPDARVGEFVCLSVSDTGCGMDEPTLKRIFDPFFTTKEPGKGTGLGLSTVYGITRQHQGWIEVDSQRDVGTTFRVLFPRAFEPIAPVVPGEKARPKGRQEIILLVEDDPAVRFSAAVALRRAGYQVVEATTGVEALRIWEQQNGHIDLLFTDMVMPEGLTGLDLADRLRELKPALRVVISSGYSVDLTQPGTRALDRVVFLPKPWQMADLLSTVRDTLDDIKRPASDHAPLL